MFVLEKVNNYNLSLSIGVKVSKMGLWGQSRNQKGQERITPDLVIQMAGCTRLELATSDVTERRQNAGLEV